MFQPSFTCGTNYRDLVAPNKERNWSFRACSVCKFLGISLTCDIFRWQVVWNVINRTMIIKYKSNKTKPKAHVRINTISDCRNVFLIRFKRSRKDQLADTLKYFN